MADAATTGPGHGRRGLQFHGGAAGALLPLGLFIVGAVALGLAGNSDVTAYWPLLTAALILGLLLARDRRHYTEAVVRGMGQELVMIMIAAWLFASVLGLLLQRSGFVEALVWAGRALELQGGAFTGVVFLIAATIGTSTGTSVGTIITATPVLYPAGVLLGAEPVALMGAILGGAAFGDNLSPISDTTIASALTQGVDIGGTVRSRLRYALPAAALALAGYVAWGARGGAAVGVEGPAAELVAGPAGWPMLAVPILVVWLCLSGRHLLEALLWGLFVGAGVGLVAGLLEPADLFSLDAGAGGGPGGLVLEGLHGGVGISIFTVLLLGVVGTLREAGLVARLIAWAETTLRSVAGAEVAIAGSTILVNLLTAHNTVTIVSMGEFAGRTGERFRLGGYRRANLLDVSANTLQHIVPYMTTVVIAATYTETAAVYGAPSLSPVVVGLANLHSWMLLLVLGVAIVTGYGRLADAAGDRYGDVAGAD